MGRVRVVIRRIRNNGDENRRQLIMQRALELSLLCDNDVALIMMGPNCRLVLFPPNSRAEDTIVGHARIRDRLRVGRSSRNEEQPSSCIQRVSDRLRAIQNNREAAARSARIEELQREVARLIQDLRDVRERIRRYESDPRKPLSLAQAQSFDSFLAEAVIRIHEIKQEILREHVPPELRPLFQAMMTSDAAPMPVMPLPARILERASRSTSSVQPSNAFVDAHPLIPATNGTVDRTTNEECAGLPTVATQMALQEIEDAPLSNEATDETEEDGYAEDA